MREISGTVVANGENALSNATIMTDAAESNVTIVISINGTNENIFTIFCNHSGICIIECQSSDACTNLILNCNASYATCFVDCDEAEGIDCPLSGVYNNLPTIPPTKLPTQIPSQLPSKDPTIEPTMLPTILPTALPTILPTQAPTRKPTAQPTAEPSKDPTKEPTQEPSIQPSVEPSGKPTLQPIVTTTTTTTASKSESSNVAFSETTIVTIVVTVIIAIVFIIFMILFYLHIRQKTLNQHEMKEHEFANISIASGSIASVPGIARNRIGSNHELQNRAIGAEAIVLGNNNTLKINDSAAVAVGASNSNMAMNNIEDSNDHDHLTEELYKVTPDKDQAAAELQMEGAAGEITGRMNVGPGVVDTTGED